jgi:hypothetical protein
MGTELVYGGVRTIILVIDIDRCGSCGPDTLDWNGTAAKGPARVTGAGEAAA